MRITDQYFWNLVFLIFFGGVIAMGTIILESEAYRPYESLSFFDYALMTLASFRLVRLFVYDKITAFFREQFFDVTTGKGGGLTLVKPDNGPRRTLADLLTCPWCLGVWATATVSFFYLLSPYALYPTIILALSGVATFLQLLSNMVGWKAEELKSEVESR